MTKPGLLSTFAHPPAALRPMPLWVWNGRVEKRRLTRMLEDFAQQGMGGVFIHPRPGLITEYLGEEWFRLWRFALSECRRLGLECQIYDENSYPAGFAGGHVPARIPYATAQYAEPVLLDRPPYRPSGEILGAWRVNEEGRRGQALSAEGIDRALSEGPVLAVELRRAGPNPWTGGFPYVDPTHPEVAREFIATTYQPYDREVGRQFGKAIRYAFCDEPLLSTGDAYRASQGLPLSRRILREFQLEHGYDLQPRLAELFLELEGHTAVRFDFYRTLQRLWTQNFLRPIFEWCQAHRLKLTGHFMEHTWPFPFLQPDAMAGYRWLHMPGIDLLAPHFDVRDPSRSALYLMTVRELGSAARQLGRPRALCEAHGVGGYQITLEDFKRHLDWLAVHGVNFFSPHLSFETIHGPRKRDCPQTFSDHMPWWPCTKAYTDHAARLSVLLTQGSRICRCLLLHPTTTGWMHANPRLENYTLGRFNDASQVSGVMTRLRWNQVQLVQRLSDLQVDFDLGDELLLAELGKARRGKLRVGKAEYELILHPAGMENWTEETLRLMEAYLASGGRILALGPAPERVRGRPDERPGKLAARFPQSWITVPEVEALVRELDRLLPPLITDPEGHRLPAGLAHQARRLAGGATLHFLVNPTPKTIRSEVRLPGAAVETLDTALGAARPLEVRQEGSSVLAKLELVSGEHALWLVHPRDISKKAAPPVRSSAERISTRLESVERTGPNALPLVFCDLTVNGHQKEGLFVTNADRLVWQAHGFDKNPWEGAVQFRDNLVRTKFGKDSGFTVCYRFEVDPGSLEELRKTGALRLAVEQPGAYRIRLNGKTLDFRKAERWLDDSIRAAGIGGRLQAGENLVEIRAERFSMDCGIEAIFLVGEFHARAVERGFALCRTQPLSLGAWTEQGLPTYSGAVRYRMSFELPRPAEQFEVRVPRWSGAAIRLTLDGSPAGILAFPPYRAELRRSLGAGRHQLDLELFGTPKNLLGPHFISQPLRNRWTGPNAWNEAPDAPAPGSTYEILPYGLLAEVNVRIFR